MKGNNRESSLYRTLEGYSDPTAGTALSKVNAEEKRLLRLERLMSLKSRRKVYVVSRYRGNIEANTEDAIRACRFVINAGLMPVASHLFYPQFLDDSKANERDMGCQFGLALLAMCDEVWVFHRKRDLSRGMTAELHEARKLKKKVRFINMEDVR